MKQLEINVFYFDELSKEVQDKVIERERWNVMDSIMSCYCVDFQKTLDEFQKITDSYVSSYQVDYCGCCFGKTRSDKVVYDDIDLEDLSGKLLFRYINNEIMPYLQGRKNSIRSANAIRTEEKNLVAVGFLQLHLTIVR